MSTSGIKSRSFQGFPTIIAIESTEFSLNDTKLNMYEGKDYAQADRKSNRPSLFNIPKIS